MDSDAEPEDGGLFHYGKITVPLRITLKELSFPQPVTPIKTDKSSSGGIVAANYIQKRSKAMDKIFYLMKEWVKQKDLFLYWKPGIQTWGITSKNITHHITINKYSQPIYI